VTEKRHSVGEKEPFLPHARSHRNKSILKKSFSFIKLYTKRKSGVVEQELLRRAVGMGRPGHFSSTSKFLRNIAGYAAGKRHSVGKKGPFSACDDPVATSTLNLASCLHLAYGQIPRDS
jgi:hypothetical protein